MDDRPLDLPIVDTECTAIEIGFFRHRVPEIGYEPWQASALIEEVLGAGQASGSGGCNTFNGPYEVTGPDSIRIGPLASTRKACPDPAMSFEATYLAALEGVTNWAVPADVPIGTQLTLGRTGPKLVFGKPAGS